MPYHRHRNNVIPSYYKEVCGYILSLFLLFLMDIEENLHIILDRTVRIQMHSPFP